MFNIIKGGVIPRPKTFNWFLKNGWYLIVIDVKSVIGELASYDGDVLGLIRFDFNTCPLDVTLESTSSSALVVHGFVVVTVVMSSIYCMH